MGGLLKTHVLHVMVVGQEFCVGDTPAHLVTWYKIHQYALTKAQAGTATVSGIVLLGASCTLTVHFWYVDFMSYNSGQRSCSAYRCGCGL